MDSVLLPFNDVQAFVDASNRLLSQPQYSEQLARFAKARTKDFSREKAVAEIVNVFKLVHE